MVMADEGTDSEAYLRLLRDSLEGKYKDYRNCSLSPDGSWSTHHASLTRASFSKGKKRKINSVVKQFTSPLPGGDPMYGAVHDPSRLYLREKTNLRLIDRFMHNVHLVPEIYGCNDEHRLLILEDLGHDNKKKLILNAGDSQIREKIFTKGIISVARFVGLCNHYREEFDNAHPYKADAEVYQSYSVVVRGENLLRMFFNANKLCSNELGNYNSALVKEYLRSKKKFDLEARLREVEDMRKALCEEAVLQHNDCNGLNMIRGKKVDLEDFGYGSWTNDISSYCIIVGLGNNAMVRSDQFAYYRHLYLVNEHAYATTCSRDSVKDLTNGDVAKYVAKEVFKKNSKKYTDWTFSFFANAVDRNVELAASYDRYSNELRKQSVAAEDSEDQEVIVGSDLRSIRELFSAITGMESKISLCTQSAGVRDFFYSYGMFMLDMGLYGRTKERTLLEETLKEIKEGTIAGNVVKDWANFSNGNG
jgi:hypothetical protein